MHVSEAAMAPFCQTVSIFSFFLKKLQTKYLGTSKNIVNLDVKNQMQPILHG
jgi:hypothetical protein